MQLRATACNWWVVCGHSRDHGQLTVGWCDKQVAGCRVREPTASVVFGRGVLAQCCEIIVQQLMHEMARCRTWTARKAAERQNRGQWDLLDAHRAI